MALQAQALAVKAEGVRKITLSDRVGRNQFIWMSEAPVENIRGTADNVVGTITLDPRNVTSIRGTIAVRVETMVSGNDTRDEHLRSPMWLDGAKFPWITFKIAGITNPRITGNSVRAEAVGRFSMHGVTRTITVPFMLRYLDETSGTRERAPGDLLAITADFSIALKDFNVAGSKGMIGSNVGKTIAINAQLFGSTSAIANSRDAIVHP